MNVETNADLARFVRDVPNFPKEGILFKDISPMLKSPDAMKTVIDIFADRWSGKVDCIAGLDARGFIFGVLLAERLGLPFVMIRKKGKLPGETYSVKYDLEYGTSEQEVQVDAFQKDSRVLIVDDLLATGGTASAACELIEKTGAIVAGSAFVIELADLNGREQLLGKYPIQTLLTY